MPNTFGLLPHFPVVIAAIGIVSTIRTIIVNTICVVIVFSITTAIITTTNTTTHYERLLAPGLSVRDELYELRLYFESTGFHWDGLSLNVLSLTFSSCLSTPEKLHGSRSAHKST